MSINVFKKHPGEKIAFSNGAVLCGELKVMTFTHKLSDVLGATVAFVNVSTTVCSMSPRRAVGCHICVSADESGGVMNGVL